MRKYLQRQWIEFDDYNAETDEADAEPVRSLYDGGLKFPTVIYGDEHLKNPKPKFLKEWMDERGITDEN